jgi:hypothetical protein
MLEEYLTSLIFPEIAAEEHIDTLPMMKATCLKFLYMFRNQIPDNFADQFVTRIASFLQSGRLVNQSYAAVCIEKLLTKKASDQSGKMIFTTETIGDNLCGSLISGLCATLNSQKNLYALRALFRVIQIAGETRMRQFGLQLG